MEQIEEKTIRCRNQACPEVLVVRYVADEDEPGMQTSCPACNTAGEFFSMARIVSVTTKRET